MSIPQLISKRLMAYPMTGRGVAASSLQKALLLAHSPLVRPVDEEIVVNPAGEMLRIWATRVKIAASAHRRIEGASALVHALRRLAPEHPVEQMSVKDQRQLGIVFFDATTHEPLGAILKRRKQEDEVCPGEIREGTKRKGSLRQAQHPEGMDLEASPAQRVLSSAG